VVDVAQLDGPAADDELAGVGLLEAGDDLHQRGLAAAVVAEQAERFALVQVDVTQGDHGPEGLGDVLDAHDLVGCRGRRRVCGCLEAGHGDPVGARRLPGPCGDGSCVELGRHVLGDERLGDLG
jgi:hypothetical protein